MGMGIGIGVRRVVSAVSKFTPARARGAGVVVIGGSVGGGGGLGGGLGGSGGGRGGGGGGTALQVPVLMK